ncbi:unnamed protein product [Chilo suppressalis]|uniref:Uncharacterized protein n=1 Tax=Chilo suppressalis TaxID=168631 RepID=A0ABN8B9E5_CHISP|nr:unnamed protein product [Chilo suppressalis]
MIRYNAVDYRYDVIDISGRDRDIGRKWESGSAKRKRKADRTASNQVLSLNTMKFLNQTASGSTEPSESIDSTSTQQTSEISLGNAPDALSSESERQLDVEFGSSSSQSKFDAETLVLSSSNQEEQIDIDSPIRSDDASAIVQQVLVNSDPGLRTFPITDSQRRDIVQSGPTQQLNSGDEYYPKDGSRIEQMSVILKFCDTSTGTIVEHFMGFPAVTKTTGEYLANAILEHLEKYDLNFQDCIRQWCKYDTRWESRVEAVKAVLLQFDEVIEFIENLKNQTEQSDTLSDCDSILNEMLSLEFIVSLHLWYETLVSILA